MTYLYNMRPARVLLLAVSTLLLTAPLVRLVMHRFASSGRSSAAIGLGPTSTVIGVVALGLALAVTAAAWDRARLGARVGLVGLVAITAVSALAGVHVQVLVSLTAVAALCLVRAHQRSELSRNVW